MPAGELVNELTKALDRRDGYIMGATGQDPKSWGANSRWFTQYAGEQKKKALYWRANAARVWDCNGLAEGIYKDFSGSDINTKARYNYSGWCGVKGAGLIPKERRVPGAAVFFGDTASKIHHVAYLVEPVAAGKPEGDWYLIEARGVMYGVVKTRLNSRKPDFWGLMTKYFDYGSRFVQVTGGSVYVRDKPNKSGNIITVVKKGALLDYAGNTFENGWHGVKLDNKDGFISGKYTCLTEA